MSTVLSAITRVITPSELLKKRLDAPTFLPLKKDEADLLLSYYASLKSIGKTDEANALMAQLQDDKLTSSWKSILESLNLKKEPATHFSKGRSMLCIYAGAWAVKEYQQRQHSISALAQPYLDLAIKFGALNAIELEVYKHTQAIKQLAAIKCWDGAQSVAQKALAITFEAVKIHGCIGHALAGNIYFLLASIHLNLNHADDYQKSIHNTHASLIAARMTENAPSNSSTNSGIHLRRITYNDLSGSLSFSGLFAASERAFDALHDTAAQVADASGPTVAYAAAAA
jgi:hypothetical protein